jgi:hypothetical protein
LSGTCRPSVAKGDVPSQVELAWMPADGNASACLRAGSPSRRSLDPFAIDTPPNVDCEARGDRCSFKSISRCDKIFYDLSVTQEEHFGNQICSIFGCVSRLFQNGFDPWILRREHRKRF